MKITNLNVYFKHLPPEAYRICVWGVQSGTLYYPTGMVQFALTEQRWNGVSAWGGSHMSLVTGVTRGWDTTPPPPFTYEIKKEKYRSSSGLENPKLT